jgi:hypothetical protein
MGAYEWQRYLLTVHIAGNGEVTCDPDWEAFTTYDTVECTAAPNLSWNFINWTGDVSSTENPLMLVIYRNLSIWANFDTFWLFVPIGLR